MLDEIQYSVIIGSLLGDGGIEKGNNKIRTTDRKTRNDCKGGYKFREEHTERQKDYLEWKASILPKCQIRQIERSFGTVYQLRTENNDIYRKLRQEWYPNGKKIVPKSLMENMNEIALMVWYLDDGDKMTKKDRMMYSEGFVQYNRARISTAGFNYKDNLFLKRILHKKFGIMPVIKKELKTTPKFKKKYYRMSFNSRTRDFDKLMEIVKRQFENLKVPKCMRYKIGERVESRRGIAQRIMIANGLLPRKNGRFVSKRCAPINSNIY